MSIIVIQWGSEGIKFGIKSHPKQKCFDDSCIPFASVSKQLICRDLILFQIKSPKNI